MSGLFGNNNNNTGGGLFGGSKPSGGGLFGNTNMNKPAGGGLFGNTGMNKPAGGGLFGGNNNQPANTGGGLFGSSSANTGGGLFGSSNTGGGMFGSSNTSTMGSTMMNNNNSGGGMGSNTTGGFFGAKPATGGGLFGGQATNTSGGLFGGSNTNTGAGTFGGSSIGTSGGGLFGSKPAATTGGLFGASNNNTKSSFFGGGASSSPFGGGATTGGSSFGGGFGASSSQANLENGTSAIHFTGFKDKDHGGDSKSVITLNSITAEPSYCTISLEELRMADYMLMKQGKVNFPIGAQPAQNKPISGFGSSSTGGGLFGSSATTNTASTSGGLFGSSASNTTTSGGGLFGNKTSTPFGGAASTTATSGGGLFGASKPATGGGLFGSKPATGGGLFGSKPATGGGLFGSSNTASTPSFGNQTNSFGTKPATTTGGLFGSSNTGAFGTNSTSAFGSSNTGAFGSGGASTFGSSNTGAFGSSSTGLFGSNNTSSGGLFGSNNKFGSNVTQPTMNQNTQPSFDQGYAQAFATLNQDPYGTKDLQEAFKLTSIDADKQAVLNEIVKKVISYSDDKKTHKDTYEDYDVFASGNSFDSTPISLKFSSRIGEEFSKNFKLESSFRTKDSAARAKDEREAYNRKLEYSRVKRDHEAQGFKLSSNSFSRSTYTTDVRYDENIELTGPNVVRVKIHVFIDDSDKIIIASIDRSRTIRELIQLAVNKLRNEYPSIETSLIQMVHKARILNQENTLQTSGIESGMSFDMLVQEKLTNTTPTPTGDSSHAEVVTRKRMSDSESNPQFVSRDKLPVLKNPEYTLTPDLIEMARMTEYDLMNIKNLSIENQHGKVQWEGRTNVINVNFDELVQIVPFAATVYPKEIEEQGRKPEVGCELNKRSIISLHKIFQSSKDTRTPAAFEESLKNRAETMDGCKYISYDNKRGVLKFQVEHFTKYDFSTSYEEEQSVENEESEQEKSNDKLKPIDKAAGNNRFSFGPQEPKGYMGYQGEDNEVDAPMGAISEQDSDEQEMDVDNKHKSYRRPYDFLDNIREEDSQQASVEMHDEDESEEEKKQHKVDFGVIYEKQFQNEQEYDDQEYEQEESEEGQEILQNSVLTADYIRE